MGFYNVQQGDAPYLKFLADNYSMSDNYHQAVMGGTGANHIMMGYGDAIWFSDRQRQSRRAAAQSTGRSAERRMPAWSTKSKTPIRPPAPITGTPKTATAAAPSARPLSAAVPTPTAPILTQPGVAADPELPRFSARTPINPRCAPDSYYLLNNYNPGYFGDGTNAYTDT